MIEVTQVESVFEQRPGDPPASIHDHLDPAAEAMTAVEHAKSASPAFVADASPQHDHGEQVEPPEPTPGESTDTQDEPPTPAAKKPKRPTRPPNTYQRDAETIREIFITRLDAILMEKIDWILEPFGLRKHVAYDIVQAVQLALFPEEFGEPTDAGGMVPISNPTRMPDAMWSARVQKFTAILQQTGDRGRRLTEGKIPIPLGH